MGKFDEKKQLAQALFIKGTMHRKQIADAVSVTEKTLRNWIEAGEWETMKEACTITRPQLLLEAYKQLKAVNEKITERGGVPNKELSDAKSILRKEIEILSDAPIHVYVEVLDEFLEFVHKNHPADTISITNHMMNFLNMKQSE